MTSEQLLYIGQMILGIHHRNSVVMSPELVPARQRDAGRAGGVWEADLVPNHPCVRPDLEQWGQSSGSNVIPRPKASQHAQNRSPRGNAMLVGQEGSGKQSLTRMDIFAQTHMCRSHGSHGTASNL